MSNFKYLPKYYKKFCDFRISQIANKNNNISLIIEDFKNLSKDKIRKKLNNY